MNSLKIYSVFKISLLLLIVWFNVNYSQNEDVNNSTKKYFKIQAPSNGFSKVHGSNGVIATFGEEKDNNGNSFATLNLKLAEDHPQNLENLKNKIWQASINNLMYTGSVDIAANLTTQNLSVMENASANLVLTCLSISGIAAWKPYNAAGTINGLLDGKNLANSNSIYLGNYSGQNDTNPDNNRNTAVGINSLTNFNVQDTTGGNSSLGYASLQGYSIGDKNTALGYRSLYANNSSIAAGSNNTGIGHETLRDNIIGNGNIAVGFGAGKADIDNNKLYVYSGITTGFSLIFGDFDENNEKVKISGSLEITGDFTVLNGSAFPTSSSDIRLKNILGNYTKGLEEINKLKTINFRYKKNNSRKLDSDKIHCGFIAQEVEKVFPEAVKKDDDGYLLFNMHPINIAMVNAVQELSNENKSFYNRITKIKDQNTEFSNQNLELEERLSKIENLLKNKRFAKISN
ncbi:MAG: tail fiber domain-containing protein [Ignavibacteriae bacterium]|nr:tail fiber domain-containing protein [Ignavibacteriota bacterium]MCB9258578.1 tail fiber domain-containing protein [Ignavibacteriales bacterium]